VYDNQSITSVECIIQARRRTNFLTVANGVVCLKIHLEKEIWWPCWINSIFRWKTPVAVLDQPKRFLLENCKTNINALHE
jgi:hypothetical protein